MNFYGPAKSFWKLILFATTIAWVSTLSARAETSAIDAKDARFRYLGRVDRDAPGGVALVWEATQVKIDFEGDSLALLFASAEGANFFDAHVDDQTEILEVKPGAASEVRFAGTLKNGRHHLTLFKRSEAGAGFVVFSGLKLAPGGKAWASAETAAPIRFLFLGDSITVGACDEDGAEDQWENRRTHNSAKSYAALVANAFGADYRNISVSGMGISIGYVTVTAGQVWNRLYPKADAPLDRLASWIPDVVFINYGENDTSFTARHGQPFPATWVEDYVALVGAVRTAYPQAEIILLRGGMSGCAKDRRLRTAWNTVNEKIEASDARINGFVFQHFSLQHPRVADHAILAGELIPWLKKQDFIHAKVPGL